MAESSNALAPRLIAVNALAGVLAGQSLERALNLESLSGRDRALARNLAYAGARWFHRFDAMLKPLLRKPMGKREGKLKALLVIGLVQLELLRVPDHAAVATTVDAARKLGYSRQAGFINAVLRRFLRERDALEPAPDDLAAVYSHPRWMIDQLAKDWPDQWQQILAANNQPPPMALRVNTQRVSRLDYLARLAEAQIEATAVEGLADGVLLAEALPRAELPGIAEGEVSIQDLAAQLAADYMDLKPGQRVLDACAAPGNKTAHMLERQPDLASLLAVELDPSRAAELGANLDRLGLTAEVRQGDASCPADWWDGQPFDRILVDAPCSATGVIRRHPDIKLLRKSDDIGGFGRRQQDLLTALWPLLAERGRLVYSTCSVLSAENSRQTEAFLASHNAAKRVGGDRQIRPGEANMDGFYYACLEQAG